jgi:hypothetical protein
MAAMVPRSAPPGSHCILVSGTGWAEGEDYSSAESVVAAEARLLRRNRDDVLGRDLARDDRHVDLVGLALARHEDRGARLDDPPSTKSASGSSITLDRTAQRPRAHRQVVTLVDEQLLRFVRQLDRDIVDRHLLLHALHLDVDDRQDLPSSACGRRSLRRCGSNSGRKTFFSSPMTLFFMSS